MSHHAMSSAILFQPDPLWAELLAPALFAKRLRCPDVIDLQLNDVWTAPTWSSIEYDGTWKLLMYNVKHLFNDISLSIDPLPH